MKLELPQPEIWERLNDAVKQELSLEAEASVRVFTDLSAAVFEIAQGTAQFMSHKKAVGWIKGQTPVFDFLLPHFYKEAYEIQQISHSLLQNEEALKTWAQDLKRDTAFILFAEDHPITGEIYPFADELDRLLNEKRIPSFRISHRSHFEQKNQIRPYTVRICAFAANLAVAVCGERFRSPALVASFQWWNKAEVIERLQESRQRYVSSPELVQGFEKAVSVEAKLWFQNSASRLWDRAVAIFPDVNGEALLRQIAGKLNLAAGENQERLPLDTTNLCYRPSARPYHGWWEPYPGDDVLSGLMIFSADILVTKDFAKLVLSSYEEVKSLQSWTA